MTCHAESSAGPAEYLEALSSRPPARTSLGALDKHSPHSARFQRKQHRVDDLKNWKGSSSKALKVLHHRPNPATDGNLNPL